MKMSHFPFYGEGKQEMTKFYFLTFSDTGYGSLEFNHRRVCLSSRQSEQVRIIISQVTLQWKLKECKFTLEVMFSLPLPLCYLKLPYMYMYDKDKNNDNSYNNKITNYKALSCKAMAKRLHYTAVGFYPEIITFLTFINNTFINNKGEFSGKFGYVLETGAVTLKYCLKIMESLRG